MDHRRLGLADDLDGDVDVEGGQAVWAVTVVRSNLAAKARQHRSPRDNPAARVLVHMRAAVTASASVSGSTRTPRVRNRLVARPASAP
ncbi:MAG: hypothetical protein ACRDUW_24340, partial [Pseudonocardiaceae bacterium]